MAVKFVLLIPFSLLCVGLLVTGKLKGKCSFSFSSKVHCISVSAQSPTVSLVGMTGSVQCGQSYTFTCAGNCGGSTGTRIYQLFRNGIAVLAPSQLTVAMFFLHALGAADNGVYTCTITCGTRTATSNSVTISVTCKLL